MEEINYDLSGESEDEFRTSDCIALEALEYIDEQIKQEINELYILAILLKEKYEDELKIISKKNHFQTRYFPDIRNAGDSVYIYWQDFIRRNMSLKQIPKEQRRKIYGCVVRMPKLGYTEGSFKQTNELEKEMIMRFEGFFVDIRKRARFLKRIQYYSNLAKKSDLELAYKEIGSYI
jgi:hypothetical protein